MKKHNQDDIKKQNKGMVLSIIRSAPISRADIARVTDMSPTSISRIVGELIDLGLIQETVSSSNDLGRKATLLDIKSDSMAAIGVYINRGLIQLGIVNFSGKVIFEKEVKFNTKKTSIEDAAQLIADEVDNLISVSNIPSSKIVEIGIGMPGIIDINKEKIILSAQLGWHNVDLMTPLKKLINKPIVIDNTVKSIALAESLYGSAKGSKCSTLISIGSGVGSALIIDGQPLRGEINSAGEIGHTTVEPHGMLCECGRRGCIQTYIAEGALIQEANKVREINSIDEIFEASDQGEIWAVNILERAAMYISIAINNVVCMYSPDTIILGGRLIDLHPQMKKLIEKNSSFIWEPFKNTFKLVYSKLGKQAVIIGAATLAFKNFLNLD